MDATTWFELVDLFGVFVGGLIGTLVARRFRYDITGIWALALVSGLGGGMIRDVLQAGPPLALVEPAYLPTVLAATAIGAVFGPKVEPLRKTILVAHAIAISGFAVAATLRTFDTGFGAWPAILLGVITAVGGGLIHDIKARVPPVIFQRSELYATAALGTSLAVVVPGELDVTRGVIVFAALTVGVGLQLGSVRYGWMSWAPEVRPLGSRTVFTDVTPNLLRRPRAKPRLIEVKLWFWRPVKRRHPERSERSPGAKRRSCRRRPGHLHEAIRNATE